MINNSYIIEDEERQKRVNMRALEFIGMAFLFYAGTYAIHAILDPISPWGQVGSFFFYLITAFFLIRVLINCSPKMLVKMALGYFLIIAVFALSYYMFPNTRPFYSENSEYLKRIAVMFAPTCVVITQITDFGNAFLRMKGFAIAGIVMQWLCVILGRAYSHILFGIATVPFIIILYLCWYESKKMSDCVWFFLALLLALWGGRQAIVIAALGVLLLSMFYSLGLAGKENKNALKFWGTLAIIVLIIALWDVLLVGVSFVLKAFDIELRSLDMLTGDRLMDTDTRDPIYQHCIRYIQNNGAKISGLFADRAHFRNINSVIAYPHSIVYEFQMDFGVILGTALLLGMTVLTIVNFLKANKDKRFVLLMIFIVTIPHLFVSSSFVISGIFLLFIGMIFNFNATKKKIFEQGM